MEDRDSKKSEEWGGSSFQKKIGVILLIPPIVTAFVLFLGFMYSNIGIFQALSEVQIYLGAMTFAGVYLLKGNSKQ